MDIKNVTLEINDRKYQFSVGDMYGQIQPNETLAHTLRKRLGLTGSKESCNQGACGCCTVIMDGDAVTSCMLLTVDCDGKHITTIEGLRDPVTGKLDPVQQAFLDHYAFQCGFCTPGIIMTTRALLNKNPHPTKEEITDALSGNYCRCISHYHVVEAVEELAGKDGE
ncbi:MAG: (2Fe-2S)-binding protein [Clostridiales bacterium]|nr:(2Fe-2S)-binding protein [Clostridiales bacterium]MCD8132663.1 (2Fe-2S)-binding protein [Clostridiales bacterium]